MDNTSKYGTASTAPAENTLSRADNTQSGTQIIKKRTRNTRGKGRKDAVDEARDLVSLLGALAQKGDTVTIDAISSRMGVSEEHARKLLLLLSSASGEYGTPLTVFQTSDDELTIAFDHATVGRPLRLTKSESIALEAALNYLHLGLDDPLRKRVEHAYISRGVSAKEVAKALAPTDGASNADALSAITRAMAQQSNIEFTYQGSVDTAPKSRLVRPLGIRRGDSGWYLEAYDVNRKGERTFRVERMAQVADVSNTIASSPSKAELNVSANARGNSLKVSTTPAMAAESVQSSHEQKARRVTLTFLDPKYLSLFEWPGLRIISEKDERITATIPYYEASSMWLPRHVAACAGKVTTDDAQLQAAIREYISNQL